MVREVIDTLVIPVILEVIHGQDMKEMVIQALQNVSNRVEIMNHMKGTVPINLPMAHRITRIMNPMKGTVLTNLPMAHRIQRGTITLRLQAGLISHSSTDTRETCSTSLTISQHHIVSIQTLTMAGQTLVLIIAILTMEVTHQEDQGVIDLMEVSGIRTIVTIHIKYLMTASQVLTDQLFQNNHMTSYHRKGKNIPLDYQHIFLTMLVAIMEK